MKQCLICQSDFEPGRGNRRTCSPTCSALRKTRRERAAHIIRRDAGVVYPRFVPPIDRAVRLLFAPRRKSHGAI